MVKSTNSVITWVYFLVENPKFWIIHSFHLHLHSPLNIRYEVERLKIHSHDCGTLLISNLWIPPSRKPPHSSTTMNITQSLEYNNRDESSTRSFSFSLLSPTFQYSWMITNFLIFTGKILIHFSLYIILIIMITTPKKTR